jgi:hypothetical protein
MVLTHGNQQLYLGFDIYKDLPLNALVFYQLEIAVRTAAGYYSGFESLDYYVYYGEGGWEYKEWDVTERAFELAGGPGEEIHGIKVRLWLSDLCPMWCGQYGDGYPHTLEALFDNIRLFSVASPTAVRGDEAPARAAHLNVYPNPFNPQTRVSIELNRPGGVTLAVYDLTGRRVRQLLVADMAAGLHTFDWDGHDDAGRALPGGIYIVWLRTDVGSWAQKVVLLN